MTSERQRRREARIRQLEQERDAREREIFARVPELAWIKDLQAEIGLDLARLLLKTRTKFGKSFEELKAWSLELSAQRDSMFLQHKIDPADLEMHWDCPDCQNTGWLPAEPAGPDTVLPPKKCRCLIQEEFDDLYRASGLVGPMREQTFAKFETTVYPAQDRDYMAKLMRYCKQFAESVTRGEAVESLLLMGDVGRGKTFLSSAIANVVVSARKTVVYLTFSEFLDLVRMHKFDDDEVYQEGVQRLMDVDLLILDDLGAEKVTEFVAQELFTIINHRMNRKAPMVASTNLGPAELEETYGSRIASRLLNGFDACLLKGQDVRKVLRERRMGLA
ncbi:MAG TPA: ATP-binding protein [Symbiobacteriaceae bacterium]|nr:ATP-binding protein [Symbiobacteriaceae bacterium]